MQRDITFHVGSGKELSSIVKNLLQPYLTDGKYVYIKLGEPYLRNVKYVLAIYKEKILVGAWQFELNRKTIHSQATIVHKKYQRQGVSRVLWKIGIARYSINKINVDCASRKGLLFIKNLQKELINIKWSVQDETYAFI